MAGAGNQEKVTECSLGFDQDRTAYGLEGSLFNADELIDCMNNGGRVSIQLMHGGRLYCAGHKYITLETLPIVDPDYRQRGARIDDKGVLANLHGRPVCWHCKHYDPSKY